MFSEIKEYLIEFLNNYAIWICVAICIALLICIGLIIWQIAKNTRKKGIFLDNNALLEAIGGKDNIKEVSIKGSRISISFNNDELINQDNLKSLGISSIIKMSDHYIFVSQTADKIYQKLI